VLGAKNSGQEIVDHDGFCRCFYWNLLYRSDVAGQRRATPPV